MGVIVGSSPAVPPATTSKGARGARAPPKDMHGGGSDWYTEEASPGRVTKQRQAQIGIVVPPRRTAARIAAGSARPLLNWGGGVSGGPRGSCNGGCR